MSDRAPATGPLRVLELVDIAQQIATQLGIGAAAPAYILDAAAVAGLTFVPAAELRRPGLHPPVDQAEAAAAVVEALTLGGVDGVSTGDLIGALIFAGALLAEPSTWAEVEARTAAYVTTAHTR